MIKYFRCIVFLVLSGLVLVSCGKEKGYMLDNDPDLGYKPNIINIDDVNGEIVLKLDHKYSDQCSTLLWRKSSNQQSGFGIIDYQLLDSVTFVDSTINKEVSITYTYKVTVDKPGFLSISSIERSITYNSSFLFAPTNLECVTIENTGVLISWIDNSNNEQQYIIEKNEHYDYTELIRLNHNSITYTDTIGLLSDTNINLEYRVRAENNTNYSEWIYSNINFSGIAKPTNLALSSPIYKNIHVSWRDNSILESGYEIQRKKDEQVFLHLSTVDSNTISYVDVVNDPGTYYYRVRATNDLLYSEFSSESSIAINPIPPSIKVNYPFNGNTNNSQGNGCDGANNGAILVNDRFNNPNSAYEFNGGSNYIEVPDCDPISSHFSISIWIKPYSVNSWMAIINKWRDIPHRDGWYLGIRDDRQIHFEIGGGDTDYPHTYGGAVYSDTWTHIVATYDGAKLKIYQDTHFRADSATTIEAADPGVSLRIGSASETESYGFDGMIDDIYIFDQAIDSSTIRALFLEGTNKIKD